ncbi:hypothetical protein J2X36_005455 [Methylobacterium sp. BE186]|uniref:hypothetical protein n=1 Tax=Methylobacterium sp. BE186 TaxID=2817715 RepID=UPI0028556282|nr:hypothetical protein [Methylobacterium sp. BE186]MDR7040668.1 hypothetical protein [Methylobacterium sp. BE186]
MLIVCEIWKDEKTEVGPYEFANLPRPGDTVSVPPQSGEGYLHFRVDSVTHRASSAAYPSATYLFVSQAE